MMFVPHFLLGWSWTETFYRAMVLLVVASPCALVAAIMPATLSAISNGAKHGILFKGGVHLENLSHIQAIAFDKTGTLTKGQPEVTDVVVENGLDKDDLLLTVASIESHSNHPLANAIVQYAKSNLDSKLIDPASIEDVAGWGVKAIINHQEWKIGKAGFVGKKKLEQFADGVAQNTCKRRENNCLCSKRREDYCSHCLKDMVRDETKSGH